MLTKHYTQVTEVKNDHQEKKFESLRFVKKVAWQISPIQLMFENDIFSSFYVKAV